MFSNKSIIRKLIAKFKTSILPKKKDSPYDIGYQLPFLITQQQINEDFKI